MPYVRAPYRTMHAQMSIMGMRSSKRLRIKVLKFEERKFEVCKSEMDKFEVCKSEVRTALTGHRT